MAIGSGQFTGQRGAIPHLAQKPGGVAGEVFDLRGDIRRDFAANLAIAVEDIVDPPAPAIAAIKTAAAPATTARVFEGAALNGTVGTGDMPYPRNITVTTASGTTAHAAGNSTIIGVDVNGDPISEVLARSTSAATVSGVKLFKRVTRIEEGAGAGDSTTLAYGTGRLIGLSKPAVERPGGVIVPYEIVGAGATGAVGHFAPGGQGSEVSDGDTGTYEAGGEVLGPTAAPPNGAYSAGADADPNGATGPSYTIAYEYDASQNR